MSNIFITADLHLGHESAVTFRGFSSQTEHDETIISNWNSRVGKNDSTFILGDVVFGQKNLPLLSRLNGTKKLVMGNHDKYPIRSYLPYFTQIYGVVRYKGCILSHIPVHPGEFPRFTYNIHGHLHDKAIPDPRYICVSLEQTEYFPLLWADLVLL